VSSDQFEQYKHISANLDATRASGAAENSSNLAFHAALFGGMLGAVAFLAQQGMIKTMLVLLALLLGGLVGLVAFLRWRTAQSNLFKQIELRYDLLRSIEESEEFPRDVPRLYVVEFGKLYPQDLVRKAKGKEFALTSSRRFQVSLQAVFALGYVVAIVLGLLGFIALWMQVMPAWALHP
jgi:hypothetical protein